MFNGISARRVEDVRANQHASTKSKNNQDPNGENNPVQGELEIHLSLVEQEE